MTQNVAVKFLALQEEIEKIKDEVEKEKAIKEIAYHTQMWYEGNAMRLAREERERSFTRMGTTPN
jgi:tyrosyl-tRNA synthetase